MRNACRISAYLSIFDDWDALPEVLRSVDTIADEIVVIDGAYDWIAPQLGARDPTRSSDEVYDALAPYAAKLKVVRGTWADEFEKRRAGFQACSHRYVMRFDADEVNFFVESALDRFFLSGLAVAQIDMPTFLTPSFYHGHSVDGVRQSALFDRTQIDDRQHLDWLWLILPKHLKQEPVNHSLLFKDCIAFTPHLTLWRKPFSASSRAMFYVLLWIKSNQGDDALNRLPSDLRLRLLGRDVVAGGPFEINSGYVSPSPLSAQQAAVIAPLYERHLVALAELNADLRNGRPINNGEQYNINVSTEQQAKSLGSTLSFSAPISKMTAKLTSVRPGMPFSYADSLPVEIDGHTAHMQIPPLGDQIRRTLSFTPTIDTQDPVSMASF